MCILNSCAGLTVIIYAANVNLANFASLHSEDFCDSTLVYHAAEHAKNAANQLMTRGKASYILLGKDGKDIIYLSGCR